MIEARELPRWIAKDGEVMIIDDPNWKKEKEAWGSSPYGEGGAEVFHVLCDGDKEVAKLKSKSGNGKRRLEALRKHKTPLEAFEAGEEEVNWATPWDENGYDLPVKYAIPEGVKWGDYLYEVADSLHEVAVVVMPNGDKHPLRPLEWVKVKIVWPGDGATKNRRLIRDSDGRVYMGKPAVIKRILAVL